MIKTNNKIKLILLLTLLITTRAVFGQLTVIYGYVKSNTTNVGIANHQVIISSAIDTVTSTGMNYYSSVFTSTSGVFLDSVTIPTGQNIKFKVSTLDCQNNVVVDSFFSMNPSPVNLFICDSNLVSCKADFVAYADTSNYKKYHFVNLSLNNYTSMVWHFGDGDSSTILNPVHTYSLDTTYAISLTVYDSVTGCTNTKYDTIKVSPVFYCTNSFTHSANHLTVDFFGSVNNTLPTIYKWNFGDFSTATGQNPQHIFAHAGIYKVCLQTISVNPQTLDTCIANSCQFISIQAPPVGNIWGQVFADTSRVYKGEVILYKYTSNDKYIGFDTVEITNIDSLNLSFYYFANIPYGKYLTKAYLSAGSQNYYNYGPSYFGNSFKWDSEDAFILNQGGINKPIHLTHIYTPTGSVTVEGKVMEGTVKKPGDPVPNVLLYVYDVQGDVYGYTYSDVNGDYSFSGLGYYKYYIYADVINKKIFPACVWPDEGHQTLTDINIYVGKDRVTSIANTKITEAVIFPNPAKDILNVSIKSPIAGQYHFRISNNQGMVVKSFYSNLSPDNNSLQIDVRSLSAGFYNLIIESPERTAAVLKVVIVR
jgi:PKD repeat protein